MIDPIFMSEEDIYLKPLSKKDISDEYYNAFNNFKLTQTNGHGIFPVDNIASEETLEDMHARKSIRLMIFLKETKKNIGVCSIQNIDLINRHAEIARFIWEENIRGKGIGTQVLTALAMHCFNELNLKKIYLGNLSFNIAAIKSAQKIGFKEDGVLRKHHYKHGKYHDVILSSLLSDEFE